MTTKSDNETPVRRSKRLAAKQLKASDHEHMELASPDNRNKKSRSRDKKDEMSEEEVSDAEQTNIVTEREEKTHRDEDDSFDAFITGLKAKHEVIFGAEPEFGDDEQGMYEQHNQIEQHWFDAAKKIQISKALSPSQKLAKLQKISAVIDSCFQDVIRDC